MGKKQFTKKNFEKKISKKNFRKKIPKKFSKKIFEKNFRKKFSKKNFRKNFSKKNFEKNFSKKFSKKFRKNFQKKFRKNFQKIPSRALLMGTARPLFAYLSIHTSVNIFFSLFYKNGDDAHVTTGFLEARGCQNANYIGVSVISNPLIHSNLQK